MFETIMEKNNCESSQDQHNESKFYDTIWKD